MRKQMIENAAYEVATQVRAVEETIETALVALAELKTRMIKARGVMNAGFVTTHAAFEQLAATTAGLIAARGGIAHCHSAMVEARQFIPGLRTGAWGDGQECPEGPSGAATLRVVA